MDNIDPLRELLHRLQSHLYFLVLKSGCLVLCRRSQWLFAQKATSGKAT